MPPAGHILPANPPVAIMSGRRVRGRRQVAQGKPTPNARRQGRAVPGIPKAEPVQTLPAWEWTRRPAEVALVAPRRELAPKNPAGQ